MSKRFKLVLNKDIVRYMVEENAPGDKNKDITLGRPLPGVVEFTARFGDDPQSRAEAASQLRLAVSEWVRQEVVGEVVDIINRTEKGGK